MSVIQLAKDLLHPSLEEEARKHKLKRLVQSPNSFFMDVKCPGKTVMLRSWCVLILIVCGPGVCLYCVCVCVLIPCVCGPGVYSLCVVLVCAYTVCVGCYKITTVFSHAQTVVLCVSCSTVLAQPTGGRARLTEGNHSSHTPTPLFTHTLHSSHTHTQGAASGGSRINCL